MIAAERVDQVSSQPRQLQLAANTLGGPQVIETQALQCFYLHSDNLRFPELALQRLASDRGEVTYDGSFVS